MTDGRAEYDRGDYRVVGAALTGTAIYMVFAIAVFAAAAQVSLWAAGAWTIVVLSDPRHEVIKSAVGDYVQPHVNRLWGVGWRGESA